MELSVRSIAIAFILFLTALDSAPGVGTRASVGPQRDDRFLTATGQVVAPVHPIVFFGRPSDLAFDPERSCLAIKNSHGIVFIDVSPWRLKQNLQLPNLGIDFASHLGGNGPAGILWNAAGTEVWTTDSFGWIHGAGVERNGQFRRSSTHDAQERF